MGVGMISLCDDYGVCTLCFLCSIGITKQLGGVLKLPEVLNYVGGDFNVVRSFEERDGCSGDCRIMLAFGVFMDNIDSVDSGARWAVGGVSVWMQEELVLVGYLLWFAMLGYKLRQPACEAPGKGHDVSVSCMQLLCRGQDAS
ncbi:hypothetical protein V6N12_069526 [Hibiscus sabdariffa]|uniref:Uncharacterized protein n=1 Tax=Hibiscus sabdariffa TaxID=183260 RepID=A0ABR2FE53_9ROSI